MNYVQLDKNCVILVHACNLELQIYIIFMGFYYNGFDKSDSRIRIFCHLKTRIFPYNHVFFIFYLKRGHVVILFDLVQSRIKLPI